VAGQIVAGRRGEFKSFPASPQTGGFKSGLAPRHIALNIVFAFDHLEQAV
jgi:hypothetical protein